MFSCTKFLRFLFIALTTISLISNNGFYVRGAEDEIDDDDTVDIEPEAGDHQETSMTEDEDSAGIITKSPFGETTVLFLKPKPALLGVSGQPELHAGKPVEFLVGFTNKGSQDFVLETLDASFRYPMDYTYHIQNFTTVAYNRIVKPKEQATLSYSFYTDESFAGRPFGLLVNLGYRDVDGKSFSDAVYNETINVIEIEEGFDGETFFLYIFMAALVVLLLVIGQHFLSSYSGGKGKSSRGKQVERGTTNSEDVDFEWIPKETMNIINKNNASPRTSPRTNRPASPKTSPRASKKAN